jgi:hypothetical protein
MASGFRAVAVEDIPVGAQGPCQPRFGELAGA